MVQDARGVAAELDELLPALVRLPEGLHRLHGDELTSLVRDLLALMQLSETAVVAAVSDALTRGLIDDSTAGNAAQWVGRLGAGESPARLMSTGDSDGNAGPLCPIDDGPDEGQGADSPDHREGSASTDRDGGVARPRVPGIESGHASRIAKVAGACTERRNTVLADALVEGRVGVAGARTALIEIDKVMPLLPTATRDEVFGHFLALDAGAGARQIRELTRRVIATYADEDYLHETDQRLDAVESVTWSDLPNGMSRLTADLTPSHAAQVRHAIDALSAPSPGNDCCDDVHHRHSGEATGQPDERRPEKRRADALLLLVTRAAELLDADTTVPTSGSTRLTVTIGFDELADTLRGFGVTTGGTALEAHTIRKLACDAEILPMVLGSDSQPLDVGRERRLATPAQRAAVIQRDRHCTFPGCDRPPTWCQVHHVVPWYAGGETSLENSALLCPRHHTVVHRDGYTAQVSDTHVDWDLRPGRMPGHSRAA